MINYIEKNLFQGVCNSNEFKGWLLSRRWFGDKSSLSKLNRYIKMVQILARTVESNALNQLFK
ncbi:hypothetical protein LCGC14_1599030 [marine sediment metagenome]|uniref:Uncharacterized protein n=1 Tax=marine sediment metagenome TaxID=412755 RepID=A0A0F9IC54_9ZZZZ